MDIVISFELKKRLTELLAGVYKRDVKTDPELMKLSEMISFKISSFYLRHGLRAKIEHTKDFVFDTGNEKHVGYFIWSDDLALQEAKNSRFFLLLTGFGYVSGVEIAVQDEIKYNFWPKLLGLSKPKQILDGLLEMQEKAEFTSENPLIKQYIEMLEEIEDPAPKQTSASMQKEG